MGFIRDLRPSPALNTRYVAALAKLAANGQIRIGHIDTGVTAHPALGFVGNQPPSNIHLIQGANFMGDGNSAISPPDDDAGFAACLNAGGAIGDCLANYPDHGTKTLSAILGTDFDTGPSGVTRGLAGAARGAHVVPVRIANGPVFPTNQQRDNMGRAMEFLLGLNPVPRVISISMGNPGWAGLWAGLFDLVGADSGFNAHTRRQFDRAYEMGVIVVCAAGQVIEQVVYPARYKRTIAVGGIRQKRKQALNLHYPEGGYPIPERVDVWAQADAINRAVTVLRGGVATPLYAEDTPNPPEEVSGTSYAAPQVAAAAALWVAEFADHLPFGEPDGWKAVEAFRAALRARRGEHQLILRDGRRLGITKLDIERLLRDGPPDIDAVDEATTRAEEHTNQA